MTFALYRASSIIARGAHQRACASITILHPIGSRSQSTTPPPNFKWDVADEAVKVADEAVKVAIKPIDVVTGPILNWSMLNFGNKLVFPVTYATMYYMDFLINYMPWWAAIATTTVTVKLLVFPLFVKQTQTNARVHNLMPETQKLQVKINDAMCTGNEFASGINKTKLKILNEENNTTIAKRLMPSLSQVPLYMGIFFYLRKLSDYQLESLTTGGALWFTNLTLPDPYYVLPALTCLSIYLLSRFGIDAPNSAMLTPMGRYIIRGIPFVCFLVVMNFPVSVLIFWMTNNCVQTLYTILLRHPTLKRKLKIPEKLVHDPASLPLTNQTFSGQFKNAYDTSRAGKTTFDVRRLDDLAFRKAATEPLKKSYKTPPPPLQQ